MISRAIRFFKNATLHETSPRKLALASAIGMYVAFSPFLGFHTLMLVAAGWIFRLNIPFLIAVGYGVNNPWTMIPVYMSGYLFGYWLLHSFVGVPLLGLNPVWMGWFNQKIMAYLQIQEVSFWAFMIGGNVLGLALAVVTYPAALMIFRKLNAKHV